jgi:hypothetical protein
MCAIGPPKQLTPSFAKASKTSNADPGWSRSLIGVVTVIRSMVIPEQSIR